MPEITKEQLIEKVFPLYFGCTVTFGYKGRERTGRLVGRDDLFGWQVFDSSNNHIPYHCVRSELVQLLLYKPENITDADAVACYEANSWGEFRTDEQKIDSIKVGIGMNFLDYKRADKLRALGYALDYEGVNLFDAGIAIEKKP